VDTVAAVKGWPVREPEEIQDEAYERVLDRVCAIDVGKAMGKVCTRVPHPCRPGQRRTRVWDVEATTNAVVELGAYLVGEGIERVTLESRSDYGRIWFSLREAAGLDVPLVNAREVTNAPGRPKTDTLDSVGQATMTERGMLRPSFVPPVEIRQLRDDTRLRVERTRERTRYWQRLEKLLEDSLIKVSAVASTLDTTSVRDMLRGPHRRGTGPDGARRPGPRPDEGQAGRADRSAHRRVSTTITAS
jgi:transposase